MTGKELSEGITESFGNDFTLCVELGAGDTAFVGHEANGVYSMEFRMLDKPVTPGTEVELETVKAAKPYLSITFSNTESLRVFCEFAGKFFKFILDEESKEKEGDNG